MSYRKMTKVFSRVHFDKDRQPKTLAISYNAPEEDAYGVKEGAVVISILSKDNSVGFSLSTGDVADIADVLSTIRKSLIDNVIKMNQKEVKE